MEKPAPISLEASLTEQHTRRIAEAQATIIRSQADLARIALIYGGQLYFDFTGTEAYPSTDTRRA